MPHKVNDLLHNYLKRQMPHLLSNESSSLESMSSGKATHSNHLQAQVFLFHRFVADHNSHNATTKVSSQGTWKPFGWYMCKKSGKRERKRGRIKSPAVVA
jgi:hypothetical protein